MVLICMFTSESYSLELEHKRVGRYRVPGDPLTDLGILGTHSGIAARSGVGLTRGNVGVPVGAVPL